MSEGPVLAGASAARIAPVRASDDLAQVTALFRDYAASLDVDLCFQGFEEELAGLPGAYAPPRGELLLAKGPDGAALGCIALRPLSGQACEIKRLYVRPDARGRDLGTALVGAITSTAQALGYGEIKLDTLPSMTAAIRLYRSLGFEPIPDYGGAPYPGLLCFAKTLPGFPSPSVRTRTPLT